MGSQSQDISASTPLSHLLTPAMFVKAALLCYLVCSPAVFSMPSAQPARSELEEARQFSDDDLVNYGIWGFIAGLSDYFIRNAMVTTATTTTTTTTTTAAPRFRKKNKNKKNKGQKKNKKHNKQSRIGEMEEEMEMDEE